MKLIHGDCLELMQELPDGSIDMILCDLPYGSATGKTRAKWDCDIDLAKLFQEYRRLISNNGAIVLFGNEPFSSTLRVRALDIYKYDLKWVKSKTTGFANANYRPMNKYEDLMIFSNANASAGGKKNPMCYNPQGLVESNAVKKNSKNRHGLVMKDTNNIGQNNSFSQDGAEYIQKFSGYPMNILYFDNPPKYVHPTQKPVALLEYLICTYSNESGIVLDNCMGSGSTGVACINTNRQFIGYELDEGYFKTAKNRINNVMNEKGLLTIPTKPSSVIRRLKFKKKEATNEHADKRASG